MVFLLRSVMKLIEIALLSAFLSSVLPGARGGRSIAKAVFRRIMGKSVQDIVPDDVFKRLLRIGKDELDLLELDDLDVFTRESAGDIVKGLFEYPDVTFDKMKEMTEKFKNMFTGHMARFEFEIPDRLKRRFGADRLSYVEIQDRLERLTDPARLVREIKETPGRHHKKKQKLTDILDDKRISFTNKADMLYMLKSEGFIFGDVNAPREMLATSPRKFRLDFRDLQSYYKSNRMYRARSEQPTVSRPLKHKKKAAKVIPDKNVHKYRTRDGRLVKFKEKYPQDYRQMNCYFTEHGYFPLFDRIQQVLRQRGRVNAYDEIMPTIPGTRLTHIEGKPIIALHRMPGKFQEYAIPVPKGFRDLASAENKARNPHMSVRQAKIYSDYGLYARDSAIPAASADGWICIFRVYPDGRKTWILQSANANSFPLDLSFIRDTGLRGAKGFPVREFPADLQVNAEIPPTVDLDCGTQRRHRSLRGSSARQASSGGRRHRREPGSGSNCRTL